MHPDSATRTRLTTWLLGISLLLAACTTGVTTAPVSPTPASTAPTAASVTPAAATPDASAATVQLTEADNGRTVPVPVGQDVRLVLTSTYWQVLGSSDPAVLALVSGPSTSAAPMGTCVPGAGCGAVTAALRALAPGRATITAARTTCGEALRCTGSAGAYEVTIVVGG